VNVSTLLGKERHVKEVCLYGVVFKVTTSDNEAVTGVTAAVSRPGWGMQDAPYTVDFIAGDSDGNKSKFVTGTFVVKGKPAGSTTPTAPQGVLMK